MNGGTCTDGVDSYICECDSGYTGVDCETTSKYFKVIIIIYNYVHILKEHITI